MSKHTNLSDLLPHRDNPMDMTVSYDDIIVSMRQVMELMLLLIVDVVTASHGFSKNNLCWRKRAIQVMIQVMLIMRMHIEIFTYLLESGWGVGVVGAAGRPQDRMSGCVERAGQLRPFPV